MREREERRILVTGATGYIGGRLVPRLLQSGYRVRCLVRDPSRIAGRGWEGVDVVQGDVLKPETLRQALKGVSDAYYLIHSMHSGEERFEERDRVAAANFRHAAHVAGISRIIYLGGLGSQSPGLSAHLRSRRETGDILRFGPVPVTEFRAAVVVGSGSLSFELIRYLTERLPVIICPQWVETRCQPIGIRNVLQYLIAALEEPKSIGRIFEIGGGDTLTYRKMMAIYAELRGLKRVFIPVPLLTPRLSSHWVNLITPIPSPVARLLIEGLRNEVVCQDTSALEVFDIRPFTYRESVRLALDRMKANEVETVWSGAYSSLPLDLPPPVTLTTIEGMIVEERMRLVRATLAKTFDTVARIGGENGWFYANWLWSSRSFLDRLVGGVGFRRGRRNPSRLHVGDPLDFWRVEAWDENRTIRLRAEMRMPGKAWLQFQVIPRGVDGALLRQTAFFEPKGVLGLLYWYSLYPFHRFLFSGMIRNIARAAEGRWWREGWMR